jgi:hypothetical protein
MISLNVTWIQETPSDGAPFLEPELAKFPEPREADHG